MPGQRAISRYWTAAAVACAGIGACAGLLIVAALAQDAQQSSRNASGDGGDPPAASQPGSQPGLIHDLGRWLEEGASKLKSGIEGARERLGQRAGETRDPVQDAAGASPSWPKAVSARERCLTAPNGAPDCQSAADALCRGKGFTIGKILDTQTEQKCSARLLLSGRTPNTGDCSTEIFVTRAICL